MASTMAFWDYNELDPIRVQIQLRQIEPDELREYLVHQTEDMRRSAMGGGKAFLVIEARAGLRPPPEIRKMQAEWLEQNQEYMKRSVLGIAFVIDNKLVRGALTAIFWVSRPPVPYRVFATLEEAIAHGVARCDAAKVEVPAAARERAADRVENALARYLARAS